MCFDGNLIISLPVPFHLNVKGASLRHGRCSSEIIFSLLIIKLFIIKRFLIFLIYFVRLYGKKCIPLKTSTEIIIKFKRELC